MISNQEEDEFIAVRVQDPRIQNEGSWNSYVDYKIFLHTNSKAFTAKTSCVRRRYSEFAWLKKKLQKNSGLVPVPGLPRKSFFYFSNEDFLEGRRKGLQVFLDKVVHMTVCLSDSQLHLFLQTQLPVGHIQDCVQGHTPYSVMDAILTYASSNQGLAQAQEDDTIKEPSLTVSYESMESPVPHQPCPLTKETVSPALMSCHESEPQEGFVHLYESDTVELEGKESSSLRVLQRNNHPEAVVEVSVATEVSFFVGDSLDDSESLSLAKQTQTRSCQIQAPVEVHSPMGAASEMNCGVDSTLEGVCSLREEIISTTDAKRNTVAHPDREEEAHQQDHPEEAYRENNCETEECFDSVVVLDLKDGNTQSQEDVLEDICSDNVLENNFISEVDGLEHIGGTVGHIGDASCPDEILNTEKEPDNVKSSEPHIKVDAPLESEIQEDIHSLLQVETGDSDMVQPMNINQVALEPDVVATKDESDEDSRSLLSSNESIVKVSDEESICEGTDDLILAENDNIKTCCEEVSLWSEVEASSRSILNLHMNGSPAEGGSISTHEDVSLEEDLQYTAKIDHFCKSLDLNSVAGGDLTEHSEFRILESSCLPGLGDSKCTDNESPPVLDISDES